MTPTQYALFDHLRFQTIPHLLNHTSYGDSIQCAQLCSQELEATLNDKQAELFQKAVTAYRQSWAEEREAVFQAALSLGLELSKL